ILLEILLPIHWRRGFCRCQEGQHFAFLKLYFHKDPVGTYALPQFGQLGMTQKRGLFGFPVEPGTYLGTTVTGRLYRQDLVIGHPNVVFERTRLREEGFAPRRWQPQRGGREPLPADVVVPLAYLIAQRFLLGGRRNETPEQKQKREHFHALR